MDKEEDTVAADPELMRRVEALVARTTLSRDEVINEALRGYLDWQETFALRVQEGIEAAEHGDFADADEVERVFAKHRPA
jgi:predicted transcriptional regulator